MEFEWDNLKAARNLTKHGVAFAEVATVFADPLAITFFDPAHSSSAPALQHVERGRSMKRDESTNNEDEIRPEYHLGELRGAFAGSTWISTAKARIWLCYRPMFARPILQIRQ